MKDQTEILGNAGWLNAVFNVQIASDCHIDPVFSCRDSIQESRVVKRAVPSDFETVERSEQRRKVLLIAVHDSLIESSGLTSHHRAFEGSMKRPR